MRRKIYDNLLDWKKERNGEVAIMIEGARRVGKSWIVKEFAKNEYKSFILIDFNNVEREILDLFNNYLTNLDKFFSMLQLFTSTKLYPRESVIIFDEVQIFPRARAAIKYLVADGRYDYIETGSLVSIKKNVKDIVIPSEERSIEMFPMDFEEFLWALGDDMTMPFIKDCFANRQELGPIHRKAMDYLRQYMIVGGMPQAVEKFVMTKDFEKVDEVKRDILKLYRNDIEKYADNVEKKVTAIFDEIPGQLTKHEKKFQLASISENARMRDYADSFFWLSDAKIINCCYNSTEPNVGLKLNMDRTTLKCYMADTGLLISHSFDERGLIRNEIYKKILIGSLEINEGMIVENLVSQMLRSAGHKLYFHSTNSREAENRLEIDFLIQKPTITNRHNICPLEVKSGTKFSTKSLKKFVDKYKQYLATPYILYPGDYKESDGIIYLPLYMAGLL